MEANVKAQVDALLQRDEPPELDGMSRGYEENGAVRKLSSVAIKYWNAWRDVQLQLIDHEDEIARIETQKKKTKRAMRVAYSAAGIAIGLAAVNLGALLLR